MQINYINNLTPLRGIAAILVAIYHFNEIVAGFVQKKHTLFLFHGYLMVDLFFVMSGFIMMHVYERSFNTTIRRQTYFAFIGARFARIYPLHFFTLAVAVVLFYVMKIPPNPVNNPAAIFSHLVLLHATGVHNIFTWNVPSWSISAEWWAYIVFPFLALLLSKFKKTAVLLIAVVMTGLYLCILYYLPRHNFFVPNAPPAHDMNVTYDYGYLRGLAGFMAGLLTYKLYLQKNIMEHLKKDWACLGVIAFTVLCFHFNTNDLLKIPVFMLLVACTAANTGKLYSLFQLKPLQYIGTVSYSIYMVHGFVLTYFAIPIIRMLGYEHKGAGSPVKPELAFFTGFLYCLAYLALVILLSTLSYYLIEKPCRKWLNKKFAKEEIKSK